MALTTINSGGVKDDSIVNADIKSDAAIAGSKVAPDFGSQNIVTTGKVGIGTTDPVSGDFVVENTGGTAGVALSRVFSGNVSSSAVNTPSLAFTMSDTATNDQVVASINPQALAGTGDAFKGHMRIFTANDAGTNTERLRIENNGNVTIQDGNLVVAANHGIMFNPHDATDSSNTSTGTYGSDSNLLDDYEEGSANITVYFGSSDGSDITYTSNNNQRGWYTKIGRFVHVNGSIGLANKGSGTGGFYFKGLPFVTSNKTGSRLGGVITYSANFSSVGGDMHLYSTQNTSSKVYVYYYDSDGDSHVVSNSHVANNTALRFSLTYMVD